MTSDEQIARWVAGDPVCPNEAGECCPDFSCCKPELLADLAVRQSFQRVFAAGDERAYMEFLGMFLGAAMALAGKENAYIAGLPSAEQQAEDTQ